MTTAISQPHTLMKTRIAILSLGFSLLSFFCAAAAETSRPADGSVRSEAAARALVDRLEAGRTLHLLLVQDDGDGDPIAAVVWSVPLRGTTGELRHEVVQGKSRVRVTGRYENRGGMLRMLDSRLEVALDFGGGVPAKAGMVGTGFSAESSSPDRRLERGVPRLVAGSRQDSVPGERSFSVGTELYVVWK